MGGFSIVHWMLVIGVVVILFGKGRISDVMGDVAKGIRSFRKGLNEDDAQNGASNAAPAAPPRLPDPAKPLDVTPEAASDVTPRTPNAPQRRDYF